MSKDRDPGWAFTKSQPPLTCRCGRNNIEHAGVHVCIACDFVHLWPRDATPTAA